MVLHIVVIWVMRPCSPLQYHSLEDHNIDFHCWDILKSHIRYYLSIYS